MLQWRVIHFPIKRDIASIVPTSEMTESTQERFCLLTQALGLTTPFRHRGLSLVSRLENMLSLSLLLSLFSSSPLPFIRVYVWTMGPL